MRINDLIVEQQLDELSLAGVGGAVGKGISGVSTAVNGVKGAWQGAKDAWNGAGNKAFNAARSAVGGQPTPGAASTDALRAQLVQAQQTVKDLQKQISQPASAAQSTTQPVTVPPTVTPPQATQGTNQTSPQVSTTTGTQAGTTATKVEPTMEPEVEPAATNTAGAGAFSQMSKQLNPTPATGKPVDTAHGAPLAPVAKSTGNPAAAKSFGTPAPAATNVSYNINTTPKGKQPTQAELDADHERLAGGTNESIVYFSKFLGKNI